MNGDFEQNPPKLAAWNEKGGATANPPDSVVGMNANSAEIGHTAGIGVNVPPFKFSTFIAQNNFVSAGPMGANKTVINFDLDLTPANNKQVSAVVSMRDGAKNIFFKALPATNGFQNFRIVFPACGNLDIMFAVSESGNAVGSAFRVDHVTDVCVANDPGGGNLLSLDPAPIGGCAGDPNCVVIQGLWTPDPSSIPTLSQWGLLALVSSIAIAGGLALLRSAATPPA
ncbi:MAG: hypothetical protein HY049_13055 [Acidobacteria bacterium]|nr:hypothetical protein [Acidobacteriota bacterium]